MVTVHHTAEQPVQSSTHRAERTGRAPADTTLKEIIAAQEEIFVRRQPNSAHLAEAAQQHRAGGVTSSWQITAPQPVWLSHGHGSKVYDVDGNEYVDLHGGYGAALAGHAHPAIQQAVATQISRGTHFAQPTPNAVAVARELARRFGLPRWRFANSGTEATMDAIHLMRSITGRDLIVKIEGCYHGHHDSVQVSVAPEPEQAGPAASPYRAPSSTGIPKAITDLTLIATFNDLDSVARLLETRKDQVAGMIIEPIMMNAGIIKPEPGYLASLKALHHQHHALLTFDEVKTGITVGPGGVTRQEDVQPDLITLAKSLGGGVSVAAIGGSALRGDTPRARRADPRRQAAPPDVPRQPLGAPPWFLEGFTWLYLIWSLVPIAIAALFSFNKGKSQASWQGFSWRWYFKDPVNSSCTTRRCTPRSSRPSGCPC
jgi:glutamate-1-semialdehyde 2,1-aminomutase